MLQPSAVLALESPRDDLKATSSDPALLVQFPIPMLTTKVTLYPPQATAGR